QCHEFTFIFAAMKVAIIREEKVPHDKRVPLIPSQCSQVVSEFPKVDLIVQPSDWRCYKNSEFENEGIKAEEKIDDCEIFLGIKEVPVEKLIENKTYLFFSHTI